MTRGSSISVAHRLQRVQDEIAGIAAKHGRSADDIRLIAVSKTRDLDAVNSAIAAGQTDFGENTVQDALTKIPHVHDPDVSWHFIGHLQSNKCKQVAGHFHWLHSADSFKLLNRLQRSLEAIDAPPLNCLLQVNLSGEASKSGLDADGVSSLVDEVLEAGFDRIELRGLMSIGVADDEDASRRVFHGCRELCSKVGDASGLAGFDQLSMGMSGDYALAIAEGATMLRIGTAIFGPRDYGEPVRQE